MNNNPYKVLGVSQNADDDEIKKAYRELARKYHPDRYSDTDLADLAGEKMKEVNAAYEEICRMRQGGGEQNGQGNGGYGSNPYGDAYREEKRSENGGYSTWSAGDAGQQQYSQKYSEEAKSLFISIRNHINTGNIAEAERLLNDVASEDRGGEWFFLLGCVQLHKGFYVDAQKSFETACRMEPTNNEYWTFREKMREKAKGMNSGYDTRSGGACDMCSSLICADCCCECMGGDLIPCC